MPLAAIEHDVHSNISEPQAPKGRIPDVAVFVASACMVSFLMYAGSKRNLDRALYKPVRSRELAAIATCNEYPEPPPFPGKKGIGQTLRPEGQPGSWVQNLPRVLSLRPSWCYSWGLDWISFMPESIEYVPMLWGAWGAGDGLLNSTSNALNQILPHINNGQVKRLFGMNEPDNADQANIGVSQALAVWPVLEALNVPLCGPSCVHADGAWMESFMTAADTSCNRVDWVGVHWYKQPDINLFKQDMISYYQLYNRSLVITEFAVADWSAKTLATNRYSPADVLAFAKQALPWLEGQDFIAGYAWFSFTLKSPVGASSALFDAAGDLTALGRYYASVQANTPKGAQWIRPDPNITNVQKIRVSSISDDEG